MMNASVSARAMASKLTIDVGREFSSYPGGRYAKNGPYSGQEFRDRLLLPALRAHDVVTVVLGNAEGYSGSFLEEAFGGLVRAGYSESDLRSKLELLGQDEFEAFVRRAWMYVHEEDVRRAEKRAAE